MIEIVLWCLAAYFAIGALCSLWLSWGDGEELSWALMWQWPMFVFMFAAMWFVGLADRWSNALAKKR